MTPPPPPQNTHPRFSPKPVSLRVLTSIDDCVRRIELCNQQTYQRGKFQDPGRCCTHWPHACCAARLLYS